jgi:hypothetical protein
MLAGVCLGLGGGASAQVRRQAPGQDGISRDTSQIDQALFGPDGYFLLAGGVVLRGSARFLVEQDGRDRPVGDTAVVPVAAPGGGMALHVAGSTYRVGMPPGLACPLGRFVRRDGLIAYTVLRYMNDESPRALQQAGLVRHRLAREFDGTGFETLLRAADFGATEPLPAGEGQAIASAINESNGIGAFVLTAAAEDDRMIGSYINTDVQVTYRVYLMAGAQRAEIAGVPLRYYWAMDRSGTPGVFSVEALAQDWPPGATLTDWRVPGARATQYDVVNFFQVAGVMRQLNVASPEAFGRFVAAACEGRD